MALELNGTTGVSLVQDGVVTAADLASTLDLTGKTVTLPSGTGGKLLQVQSVYKTNGFGVTSSTFTDVSGFSASITPSSTSSKILIIATFSLSAPVGQYCGHMRLFRGTTQIWTSDASGTRLTGTVSYLSPAAGGPITAETYTIHYLDSPATTSSTTYKWQMRSYDNSNSAQLGVSQSDNGNANTTPANMILMEIGA